MKDVAYVGTSDFRELTEKDFDALGESHKAMTFARGVVEELSNAAADAVVDKLEGEFVYADDNKDLIRRVQEGTKPVDDGSIVSNPGQVLDPDLGEIKGPDPLAAAQVKAAGEGDGDQSASAKSTASSSTTEKASTGKAKARG